jgi:hypothetical protein
MSEALYLERLSWDGRRGIAKSDGVAVELRACPLPKPVMEVDYSPAVRVFQIRDSADRWRDMNAAERLACGQVLQRCAAAARSALDA